MKRLVLVLAVSASALSGCAQLKDWYHDAQQPATGGSALEEQRPYPKTFPNDHYYAP